MWASAKRTCDPTWRMSGLGESDWRLAAKSAGWTRSAVGMEDAGMCAFCARTI